MLSITTTLPRSAREEIAAAHRPASPVLVGKSLWIALLLLALFDAAWLAATPLSLSGDSWRILGRLLPFAALCAWGSLRLHQWPRLRLLCEGSLFMMTAWPALRLLNHLTMTTGFPLFDAQLAAADDLIGFDWAAYLAMLDRTPALLSLMDFLYTSLSTYVAAFFIIVALFSREPQKACREFITLFFLSALVFSLIGSLFPALSAAVHYAPLPVFEHIDPRAGAYHLAHLAALRGDPAHVLNLAHMPGLVTFPSFHTGVGIIAIYCCRSIPLLLAASIVLNGLMIASTPLFGAHYLIDIIGGILMSVLLIAIHRRAQRAPIGEPMRL